MISGQMLRNAATDLIQKEPDLIPHTQQIQPILFHITEYCMPKIPMYFMAQEVYTCMLWTNLKPGPH